MIAETLAISSSVTIGFSTILLRKVIERTNLTAAMLMSILIGTIIFWIISLIFIPFDFLIYCLRSKAFPFFLIAGIFSPALARWLYFLSLDKIGASKSASILATGPAFSAIIAILFLEEHLTIPIGLGIVFTILGIILFERDLRKKERNKFLISKGSDLILPLLSAVFLGLALVFRKIGLNILNSPTFGATVGFTISLFIYSIILVWRKKFTKSLFFKKNDLLLLLLASMLLALTWLTLLYALSYGNVVIVAPLANLHPLVVVALSYVFMGDTERLTSKTIYGAVIVVTGVALITIG